MFAHVELKAAVPIDKAFRGLMVRQLLRTQNFMASKDAVGSGGVVINAVSPLVIKSRSVHRTDSGLKEERFRTLVNGYGKVVTDPSRSYITRGSWPLQTWSARYPIQVGEMKDIHRGCSLILRINRTVPG